MKPLLPLLLLLTAPVAANLAAADPPPAPPAAPAPAAKPANAPVRFDMKVRDDFFAGFGGDAKALERAMAATEATLKSEPDHAEALVWHGCGTTFGAAEAFRKGDVAGGMALWQKGLAEMDRAVKLAPDKVGVRVPRATALIPATRNIPEPQRRELLLRAKEDLEMVYRVQQPTFEKRSVHSRGELLMGLAEVYKRLGDDRKATETLDLVGRFCAATPYAAAAERWKKPGAPESTFRHACIGCHE